MLTDRVKLKERHVREMQQFQDDLNLTSQDLIGSIRHVYPPGAEPLKEWLNPIVRKELNRPGRFTGQTPLQVLPADRRTVLVQKDQFEKVRKLLKPEDMDVDERPGSLSLAEVEYMMETAFIEETQKRFSEAQSLYILQEGEKQPVYARIKKRQERAAGDGVQSSTDRRASMANLTVEAKDTSNDSKVSRLPGSNPMIREIPAETTSKFDCCFFVRFKFSQV